MSAPTPPPDLDRRSPVEIVVPAGTALHRFYTAQFAPLHFDPTTLGRLNAPDGSYGVLYASKAPAGAFAETFLRTPGRTQIDPGLLSRKAYVRLRTAAPLSFASLTGPGLAIVGATAEVTHGGLPYDVPQAWSKAISGHPARFDGIAYMSRHDDQELCYAIFERASAAIVEDQRSEDLDQD